MERFKSFYLSEAEWNGKFNMSMIGMCKKIYRGEPLEKGGTSIQNEKGTKPPVKAIVELGNMFPQGSTILDYGAGKAPPRNADDFRKKGYKVYAYDPFNGKSGVDGWELGKVSKELPKGVVFDHGFTSYVLNVVPLSVEKQILKDMDRLVKGRHYHQVRFNDMYAPIYKGLNKLGAKPNTYVYNFFKNVFAKGDKELLNRLETKTLTEFDYLCYARFGYQSGANTFQRLINPSDNGLNTEKAGKGGFALYSKA